MAENEVVRVIRIKGVPEGLEAVAAKLNAVEDAYTAVAVQGDKAAAATQRVEKAQASAQGASAAVAQQTDKATAATQRMEKSQLSAQSALDRVQRSLDEQYRMQERLARVQSDLQRAYDQGLVSEQRHAQLLELANRKYGEASAGAAAYSNVVGKSASIANDNFAKSTGLARHELINLGRQAQDIGTQLALGQSPMQVLASQAAQVADIFMSTQGTIGGFFRQAAGGAARFAMSGAGLATGGAALGVYGALAASSYVDGQKSIENALRGVGAASGVTLASINRLADAQASAARVSTASAREMAAAYAGTGRVDPTQIPGLLDFTRQYAAFGNLGNSEASAELAKAFADPTRGAETLADKLGGLNSAAQRWIRDQQAAGNMLGAQNTLLETFRAQVEGSTDRLGFFARAWDGVKRSISDADDALGRFLAGSLSSEQQLAALQAQRDRFAALPTRTSRATGHVAALDAEIAKLSAIVELERQRAAIDARVERAANSSRLASAISDRIDPYSETLRQLTADKTRLEEAMKLNPRSGEYDSWAKSLDRINGAMATLLPASERERRLADLNIQAIGARTLAERTAIEVQREAIRLSGEKVSATEREIALQSKAAEIQAQANREARDALRSAQDRSELAGLRPYERRRREIELQYRDNAERFGGGSTRSGTLGAGGYFGQGPFLPNALPATTGAIRGLDVTFAESLAKLQAAIPGITVTSGFRSYEQQAKLYAEKPGWAVPPGRSQHERGLAADIAYNGSGNIPAWIRERAAEFGLSFPIANRAVRPEPWHVEPVGGRGMASVGAGGPAADIRARDLGTADLETYNSIVRSANDNLRAQQAQLDATRQTMFQTTEEVVKAQKYQELYNQAVQEGGTDLASRLAPSLMQVAAGYGALARQQEEVQRTQEAMKTIGDLGRQTISGFVSDLRNGASGAEIFRNALDRIASKLMDMALNDLFGKAFGNNSMGLFGNGGFFSSLFGGLGGSGSGSIVAGTGGLIAVGSGGGYASGGYTGAGGKYDPAGIVHRGEYVFSAASVGRIGLGNLDSMHRGALRGYADGGYVSPAPYIHPPANQNGSLKVDIHNTVSDRADVKVGRNRDGSLKVMITAIKGDIAQDLARGQGSIPTALRATQDGRQLRG